MRAAPLALTLALLLALAAPAAAAPARHFTTKKAIWGPVVRDGKPQFPIYHDLGAGIWEYPLSWNDVAPTKPADPTNPADPAYNWPPELDQAVAAAKRYRMKVMIQLARTPPWANGGQSFVWVPTNPADLANFAAAAARRYPSVRLWQVWGEPSRQGNFLPLTPETKGSPRLTAEQAAAPRFYARMLDASYAALKRVRKSNLVIGGNTFTVGDISPYNWIRYLRLPNGKPPRMDLFGHNPFTSRKPNLNAPHPTGEDVNYSDFSDLKKFTAVLDRNVRDPRGKRLRLFLSEFFFPTDHPNWEFPFWVDRSVQASWLDRALRISEGWSRIYTLGWYSLYDDAPRPDNLEVNRGLVTYTGRHKPSYGVFRRR
jgi:hypothetical protein